MVSQQAFRRQCYASSVFYILGYIRANFKNTLIFPGGISQDKENVHIQCRRKKIGAPIY